MKKISKMQIFAWVLAVVPVVLVAVFYSRLPDQVPTHWEIDGGVTYGSKTSLWMIALLPVVFAVLFPVLPRIDPRRRNYDKFSGSYDLFQVLMMLFLIGMTGIILVETFHPGTVDVGTVVIALCSLLFVALGNMMPKFRHNYFIGMRNPWTLASETVWVKTHRLSGKALFIAGILGLFAAFLPNDYRHLVFVALIIAAVAIPSVMSYLWYRKEQEAGK